MDELLKNHLFATHAIAAAGTVTLGTAVTYPLDTIKVLIQVGSSSNRPLKVSQALNRIRSLSGISGLYSGFGWSTSERILGMGARFGIYEILTAFYKGMAAGAMESVISSPFELIKLRTQVASASCTPRSASIMEHNAVSPLIAKLLRGYTPEKTALNNSVALLSTLSAKHPNLAGALQEYPWMMTGSGKAPSVFDVWKPSNIISLEGWCALWRGLRPGVVRDSIYGGIFFSSCIT
ncbi:uncharacterized protein LOC105636828 [Jatropha curcas]|uniref:uncharacterized protein LOC105636828 n=1 Tax=Jatropha curcas TaxID=180498 RepID=UPI0018957F6A|nr:uncharacterized protein LOC105636828 [Jatropha curcas]